jgi:hypothetical protein
MSAILSVPTAGIAAGIAGWFWTPGWMVVHYVVPPQGMKDLGRSMVVGIGLDSVLCCAAFYWILGRIFSGGSADARGDRNQPDVGRQ